MTDTPRTDAACYEEPFEDEVPADFARQLERELNQARSELEDSQNRMDYLEEELNRWRDR